METQLKLSGQVIHAGFKDEFPTVRVQFAQLSLEQHRQLVEMLFCRPGQWKHRDTPGEFDSILLLFRILLKPRILFERDREINAITVSKV